MTKLKGQIAMSLDGFVAGPDQSEDNPLGVGGMRLHEWAIELAAFNESHGRSGGEVNASTPVIQDMFKDVGAILMGRNMFGPVRGDWGDESWNGWWGDDPPYHVPVFVLTHHAREPVEMEGGTTFHFVTDGIKPALEQAKKAAGGADVKVAGGASAVAQYLRAGLIDELTISLVPVILGDGERLLTGLDGAGVKLEQIQSIEAPGVTHLIYAVSR
jgi:dihydrofolate reductase